MQVCVAEQCQAVPLTPSWRIVALPVALPAQYAVIELRSPTFVAPDGRRLGVLLDWAGLSRDTASIIRHP